ncbi:MAG: IS30 family transposase [Oscillospiraceae bacterium]|nr:IS30 family transposase [Oscillospiraceae bacterium]
MGHHHSHLTLTDRRIIEKMLNVGRPKAEIAEAIHVHVSTIYREVKRARMIQRNSDLTEVEKYNPDEAERQYRENLSAKGAPLKIGNDRKLAEYLENKVVKEGRSPAAALADIAIEGKVFSVTICTGTFYSYIEKGVFLHLTNKDLPEKSKRKRPYHHVKEAKRAPKGTSIEKRPEEVESREAFGNWEMDTVYSKKEASKNALLVLTERKTREEIIERMPDRTKESTVKALDKIEQDFGADFRKVFKTITVDNGGEFADVEALEKSTIDGKKRTALFFCHPYSSYERGSNENQNRMIRRRHPKGTDFGTVTDEEIKETESWMNNYPRKILGWKTSAQLFKECLAAI